ncbi:hypothetical protein BHM03_00048336, partial [Ensete ventricosum]
MFSISICTARYGRYVSVCHIIGTLTARYRAVPLKSTVGGRFQPSAVDFSHRRSIEGEKGKKKKKKRKRRKKKEERRKKKEEEKKKVYLASSPPAGRPCTVAARGSPTRRRRPCPLVAREPSPPSPSLAIFLPIPLSTDGMYWSDKEPVWLKSLDVSRGFDGVPVFQVGSLEDVLKKME